MKYLITILSAAIIIFFVGCEQDIQSSPEPLPTPPPFPDVNETLYESVDILKKADYEELKNYILYDENNEYLKAIPFEFITESEEFALTTEIATLFFDNLECRVISVEQVGENATAIVEYTSFNGGKGIETLLTQLAGEYASAMIFGGEQPTKEEIAESSYNIAKDILSDEDTPTTVNTVDVSLTKGDERWLIIPNEELIDAITGNLISKSKTLYEQYGEYLLQTQ